MVFARGIDFGSILRTNRLPLARSLTTPWRAQASWQAPKRAWCEVYGLDDSVGREANLFPGRAAGAGGFTICGATTSLFDSNLADVVRM